MEWCLQQLYHGGCQAVTVCDGGPHWSPTHSSQDSISNPRRFPFTSALPPSPHPKTDVSVARPLGCQRKHTPVPQLDHLRAGLRVGQRHGDRLCTYQDNLKSLAMAFVERRRWRARPGEGKQKPPKAVIHRLFFLVARLHALDALEQHFVALSSPPPRYQQARLSR